MVTYQILRLLYKSKYLLECAKSAGVSARSAKLLIKIIAVGFKLSKSKLNEVEQLVRFRRWKEWTEAEDILMAHRYLYYITNTSIISDQAYDDMEYEFLEYGSVPKNSPCRKPGSENQKDYPEHIRGLAMYFVFKYSKRNENLVDIRL